LITHSDAIKFVKKRCKEDGLDKALLKDINTAKRLREFVNYGPRITVQNGQPYFGPCDLHPDSVDRLVISLDGIFRSVLAWARAKAVAQGALLKDALSLSPSLFRHEEPFYDRWCSPASVDRATTFLDELDSLLKTSD
jgi:hypothetical protein